MTAGVQGAEGTLHAFVRAVPYPDPENWPNPTDAQLDRLERFRQAAERLRAEPGSSSSGLRRTVGQFVTRVRSPRPRRDRDRDERRRSLGAASSTDSPFEVSARTVRRYDI